MATKKIYHIRRCHVCGTVNELENAAIQKCSHCRKHLAPFYYFDESELKGVKDNQLEMSLWNHQGSYHPLWGLSTYWEDETLEDTG
jgi:hypothetical protein